MSSVITIEQVEKLVRQLPKKVSKEDYNEFSKTELYYNTYGEGHLRWFTRSGKGIPYDIYVEVDRVYLSSLYEQEGSYYKRKGSENLNEKLYHRIKDSEMIKRIEYARNLEDYIKNKVSGGLENVKLGMVREGSVMGIKMEYNNEELDEISFKQKESKVKEFLEKEEYGVGEVNRIREGSKVVMYLSEGYVDEWEGFVKGVVDLDKRIERK